MYRAVQGRTALPGDELHGPAIPRTSIVQPCENRFMPRNRRLFLDQFEHLSGPPIFHADAAETGFRTSRSITVAPLSLVLVRVRDAYDPPRLDAFATERAALAEAERLMADPDSRGILRQWRLGDQPSGETLFSPGGSIGRRGAQ